MTEKFIMQNGLFQVKKVSLGRFWLQGAFFGRFAPSRRRVHSVENTRKHEENEEMNARTAKKTRENTRKINNLQVKLWGKHEETRRKCIN